MNDNTDRHLDELFEAARQESRDTSRVEWGFETRLTARLREEANPFAAVMAWAWRLCPFFAALAVAAALWSRSESGLNKAEEFLASESGQNREESVLLAYFTGENR